MPDEANFTFTIWSRKLNHSPQTVQNTVGLCLEWERAKLTTAMVRLVEILISFVSHYEFDAYILLF